MTQFKDLDPLLHSQLRLSIVSLLLNVEFADFVFIKEATGATAGNLSVQIDKLATASYIEVEKRFVGKRPQTRCKLTAVGRKAFKQYVTSLRGYIEP